MGWPYIAIFHMYSFRGYRIMLCKGRSGGMGRREDSTVKQLGRQHKQFSVKVFATPSSHTVLQGLLSHCSHRKQTDLQGKSVHVQASSRSCSLVLIIYFVSGNYGATTHMILSTGIRWDFGPLLAPSLVRLPLISFNTKRKKKSSTENFREIDY